MLDPRRVLTFHAVVLERSFSRAAAALALTQPAVSQHIRALEVQLGARLIDRGGGRFTLTPAGELLAAHAAALVERLELAETQLAEVASEQGRSFRVGAFPSALARLVPPAAAALGVTVDVSATQGSTDELVGGVRDGSLHVALCFQDAAQPRREHLGTRRSEVVDEAMVAVLGPGHRLAGRRRIALTDLAEDRWLVAVRGGIIERACLVAGFEPRIAYVTADPLAINGIVAADLCVTLTSELLAPQLRGVASVPLRGEPARRTIYAVVPETHPHPLTQQFIGEVRTTARAALARR